MTSEEVKEKLSDYYREILKKTNNTRLSADDEFKTLTDDEIFDFIVRLNDEILSERVLRYNKVFFKHPWHSYAGDSHLIPDSSGEWVKFKDIKQAICR